MGKKKARAPDVRQTSFVVAKADVLGAIKDEETLVTEKRRQAWRRGDAELGERLSVALVAVQAIRDRVEKLG